MRVHFGVSMPFEQFATFLLVTIITLMLVGALLVFFVNRWLRGTRP
jgi:hypothetical protein